MRAGVTPWGFRFGQTACSIIQIRASQVTHSKMTKVKGYDSLAIRKEEMFARGYI